MLIKVNKSESISILCEFHCIRHQAIYMVYSFKWRDACQFCRCKNIASKIANYFMFGCSDNFDSHCQKLLFSCLLSINNVHSYSIQIPGVPYLALPDRAIHLLSKLSEKHFAITIIMYT